MNKVEKWLIWGTGSLCERFLNSLPEQTRANVCGYIDSGSSATMPDAPVLKPDNYLHEPGNQVFICSSWINDIIPLCERLNIPQDAIFIVQPRSLDIVPLTDFEMLSASQYYYLPWKAQMASIQQSLSIDIVQPDVYQDLIKSVGYCFFSSVEGDFAEFGTCSGYTASLIAHALQFYSTRMNNHEQAHQIKSRELCLFDSFEGFPEATLPEDLESPHVASGVWGVGTAKGLSADELYRLCAKYFDGDKIKLFEGWFKNTLSNIEPSRRFAFVHLDCDLYESTIDVLNHLFSQRLLSSGAMLLFDNWYCNRASADFGEQKAWQEINKHYDIECTDLGIYGVVGHRKIIHNYRRKN